MTTALPLEVLERPVLRADWLAVLAELSRLRLVASDDTDRLSEGIRRCFDDERISPGAAEESVLFERRSGGATHLGAHGDLAEVFVRLRALLPERVLHDPQSRLFALVLVGYAFRAGVLSDADLSLAPLLIVALPGARRSGAPTTRSRCSRGCIDEVRSMRRCSTCWR